MVVLEDIVFATANARVKKDSVYNIVDLNGKEVFPYVLLDVSKNSTYLIALHNAYSLKLTFIPTAPPLQYRSYMAYSPFVMNVGTKIQIGSDTLILKILDDSHLVSYVIKTQGTAEYKIELKTPMQTSCQGKTIGDDDFSYTMARYTIVPPQSGDNLYHIVVKKENEPDIIWKEFISFGEMLLEITPGASSYKIPEEGYNFMRFRPHKIIM